MQFWQFKKIGNKVNRFLSFLRGLPHHINYRVTTLIVREIIRVLHATFLDGPTVATKTPQQEAPVLGRGALCADSMGLVSLVNFSCPIIY